MDLVQMIAGSSTPDGKSWQCSDCSGAYRQSGHRGHKYKPTFSRVPCMEPELKLLFLLTSFADRLS